MAEKPNTTSNYPKSQGLVSALSERFKIRSASETRTSVTSKTETTPVSASPSVVTKRPPLARNTPTSTSIGQPSTSKPPATSPAVVGPKQFKKCKSATFQIDGHYYTIGLYIYAS